MHSSLDDGHTNCIVTNRYAVISARLRSLTSSPLPGRQFSPYSPTWNSSQPPCNSECVTCEPSAASRVLKTDPEIFCLCFVFAAINDVWALQSIDPEGDNLCWLTNG